MQPGTIDPADFATRVKDFVRIRIPWLAIDLNGDTDVVAQGKIGGDDLWDFIEEFAEEFQVDMTGFRWYHHSGPEGCNPIWLLFPPWWVGKTQIPIRVGDLIRSAQARVWSIEYPREENTGAERSENKRNKRRHS
jgi:Protein of unknown function (DUF1493)